MLYATSPAVQARVDAYLRKPALAPHPLPGEPSGRLLAEIACGSSPTSLTRVPLVSLAIRELSTSNPED